MQEQVTIRRIVVEDIDAVVRMYSEIIDSTYISFSELSEGKAETIYRLSSNAPAIFREQVTRLLQSPQHAFFVATVNNESVGFALASLHKAETGRTECWLDDIGVIYEWRRQGIAKELTSEVFKWGAKEKVAYYLLESGVRNESAHYFFESLGFQHLSVVFWREG